jgi:hypothetical protein
MVENIKQCRRKWLQNVERISHELGRPRRRWENNIKMDLREIGFGDMDWIHWAQDRDRWWALLNTVMNLGVP